MKSRFLLCIGALSICYSALLVNAVAQDARGYGAPSIEKIDPPNWWAQMPAPMLLVRGENLGGASFSLSDSALKIEKTNISENGHWAQLWLASDPARPETVTLRVENNGKSAEAKYRFGERKPATAGFAGFSSADVMYLIMTDRFADGDLTNDGPKARSSADSEEAKAERAKPMGWHGGDYRGIEKHLDYLQQFGVTAIWITPPYENLGPTSYHGYHATDMYRVDPHAGSMEDLQHLAQALHKRGMKLVLDTVPNHVGPLNPWVQDEPTPVWFHGTAARHLEAHYDFNALIDPHATEHKRRPVVEGWFVNELPDMDTDDPVVAQYLRQNAVWWIEETGADGLRIDTFPYVNREFWHDFHAELHGLYPRLTEVGEVSTPDPVINSSFADGVTRAGVDTGLYTPFDFPMYHAMQDTFVKGAPMARLAEVLEQDSLYPHPDRLVPFLDNHDEQRIAQQVPDPAELRVAFAFLLTTRGTPQLYSGDEIAMPGGADPDDRRDFPGGFPGATQDAFTQTGRTAQQQQQFSWLAGLTRVRREHPVLACGGEQVLLADKEWLVTLRDGGHDPASNCTAAGVRASGERVIVALHRGAEAAQVDVPMAGTWADGCKVGDPLIAEGYDSAGSAGDGIRLNMGAKGVLIAVCR